MYSKYTLNELMNKNNKKLIFIHTPKCGGSYVSSILSHLNISIKGHHQAKVNDGITFTVIRNPIDRFESLLNYRLNENEPRNDWPYNLQYAYSNKSVSLNEIVRKMTDRQILGFKPYNTLTYWTKNIDIIITLDNLPILLEYFGYTYDKNMYNAVNVSNKTRGKLNERNRNKIKYLYYNDVLLYNKVIESKLWIN